MRNTSEISIVLVEPDPVFSKRLKTAILEMPGLKANCRVLHGLGAYPDIEFQTEVLLLGPTLGLKVTIPKFVLGLPRIFILSDREADDIKLILEEPPGVIFLPFKYISSPLLEFALKSLSLCTQQAKPPEKNPPDSYSKYRELLTNTLENKPEPILILGDAYKVFWANLAAEKLWEASNGSLEGRQIDLDENGKPPLLATLKTSNGKVRISQLVLPLSVQEPYFYLLIQHPEKQKSLEQQAAPEQKDESAFFDKYQDLFWANISHEMRTPLNGIMGMIELLLKTPLNSNQRGYMELLHLSAGTLRDILVDMLDYFFLDSKKVTISEAYFNLHKLIRQCVQLFIPEAQQKGIKLFFELGERLPVLVKSDPKRIRQILVSLLSNAVKFTRQGHVRLGAHLLSWNEDKALIRFDIEDTGIGIPGDKLQSIFELPVKDDMSKEKHFKSAGFGLMLCRNIAEILKGEIKVQSSPGKGSLFSFTVSLPAVSSLEKQVASDETRAFELPVLSVLVAEDNLVNQMVVCDMLSINGHTVYTVDNGQEAVDFMEQETVDALLLDIQMPIMDGIQVASRLRSQTNWATRRDLPIIVMTAHCMPGEKDFLLSIGVDEVLFKPVSWENIEAALVKVLCVKAKEPEPQAINEPWLMEKARENRQFIGHLFAVFLKEQPEKLKSMKAALAEDDIEQLIFLVHSLKGGAATLGAEQLYSVAKEMEAQLRQGQKESASSGLAHLEKSLEKVYKHMERFIEESALLNGAAPRAVTNS